MAAGALTQLQRFQSAYSSHELAEDERKQGFVWSFTAPFVQLTASHHSAVKTMGAFSLAVLSEKGLCCPPSHLSCHRGMV